MPVYKSRTAFEIARGVKAFFDLRVGLTRGEAPDPERRLDEARVQLRNKDRRIEQLQRQLADRDRTPQAVHRRLESEEPESAGRRSEREDITPLHAEFEKRGPWVTRFVIDGVEYGGGSDAMKDVRVDQFFRFFPNAGRILELGSLEGGHTFNLASRPGADYVLGVEGRRENVERAEFVRGLLGVENVEFRTANLEEADLASFGEFDAVFCSGLLYHLPEPWKLIEQISRVSPNLFVWTHYARGDVADSDLQVLKGARNTVRNGLEGWEYREGGLKDPLSGMSPSSFWPTLDGLRDMLKTHGFEEIHLIRDNPNNPHGPAITLAAMVPSSAS